MSDFTPVAAEIKAPQINFNPMQTAEGAMALQGGMLRNRLLGLQVGGQQAIGQIIGQNTDPTTGETDWQKVSADAAQNPAAAILMPQIQQQVLARQLAQVQLQREQLGYSSDEWQKISGAVLPLVQKYGTPGKDGELPQIDPDTLATELTTQAGQYGLLQDPKFATRLASLTARIGKQDSATNLSTLKSLAIMGNPTPETVALVNGSPTMQNTGGQQRWSQVSGLTGTATPMAGASAVQNNTLSPEAEAAPRTVVTPKGVPEQVPTSAVVTPTGQPRENVPGVTGPRGEVATGLAPGVAQAIAEPVAERGQRAAQIEQAFTGSKMRQSQLAELAAANGDFRSGPGAASWSRYVTEANRIFGTHYSDDSASAQQVFEKIASQVAAAQRETMGSASTNAQTELAQLASPGSVKSPEANQQVIALLRGNEDWIQAKAKAWRAAQKAGATPDQLDDFEQQFSKLYDPRYFQERYMTAQQRGAMAREMGPKAYQAFEKQRKEVLGYTGIQ